MAFASLDMHQVSWSPLWIPKLWQRHLWPWIEGKWLLLRSNMDKGNPVCPSYWHQTSILIFKTLNIIEILQYLLTCLFFYLLFNMFINIYKERERETQYNLRFYIFKKSWVAMIFSTQGSNPGLPHCRHILYCLSHQGSPWILEWVAMPFSRGSSQLRNQTRVSCIVGGFFTNWATREALHFS